MKKIEYWQFMQWDGGDRHHPKDPAFFNKADADAFLGDNKYDLFDKKTVYIYESLEDYLVVRDGEAKESGLAKLTDVEKRALGLI
jgi:hypothetical protein